MKQGMLSRAIRSSAFAEVGEVSKYELRSCAENSSCGHLKLVAAAQIKHSYEQGGFKRPKKCLTPSENKNSKNRLKIWQIPIQS